MTTDGDPPSASSGNAASYKRLGITAVLILFLDQLSKWIIVHESGFALGFYPPAGGLEVIPGFFNLVYAVNYGAAWGMLQGFSWFLVLLAVVIMGLIALYRHHLQLKEPLNQWVFGLIIGGIIGNSIDRVFRGHVVDFLDFHLPFYRWPTFNVADSAIVVGTIAFIILQFRKPVVNSG